jgi:uracil-DNA glycosylase family 4
MPATHFNPDRSQFRRATPFTQRNLRVPGEGPDGKVRCLLIGEKPGRDEAHRGRPFIGISGKYLDIFLNAANIDRQSLYVTNLVKEFTEYSKPSPEEIRRDHDELIEEIRAHDPDIIGLVGGWAVEHVLLTSNKPEMDRIHGTAFRVPSLFGDELYRDGGDSWTVVPLLHPANCIHSPDTAQLVLDDFLNLGRLMDGEITVHEPDPYLDHEQYSDFHGDEITVRDDAGVDTEGSRVNPWCLTLSTQPGTSKLVKPGQGAKFLSKVYLHNALWDLGVLRSMGVELDGDQYVDSMIMAFNLCIEPLGLKALLYRHCAMQQDDYSDIIHEASQAKALDYLVSVLGMDWPDVEPLIVFEGGKPKLKKPWNINRRVEKIITDVLDGKVDKDGNPTDPRKRWKDIDDYVKDPVEDVMGPMLDATLDDIPYEKAQYYACRDSDGTRRLGPILEQKIRDMDLEKISRIDHDVLPMFDRMQQVGIKLAPAEFWDKLADRCDRQMDMAKWKIYQSTGWDLNPMSGDQVAALLYGPTKDELLAKGVPENEIVAAGLGLTPPKMTDGGKTGKVRGSTNDKCLENLLPISPIVEEVMTYREANKVKGTYVKPLRRMATTGDGRAHPGIKPTRVSSGRIATADPNLLAIPIRSDLGGVVREGFVAEDGYVLYDADLSQAEMRCMAHDSRDEKLIKVFEADLDVHRMTAAEMFSTKPDLVEKWQRNAAKQVGFGIINLISEYGLLDQMILYRATRKDGSRWTLDDCEQMIDEWFKIYPGVKRYHNSVIEEARQTGLSRESIGGRIRYVPGVWSPIGKIRGDAEREACSHRIQSMATSFIKIGAKIVWDVLKSVPGVDPLLLIHDEVLFRVKDDEDTRNLVSSVVPWGLESAVKLRVPMIADGKFGKTWASAH